MTGLIREQILAAAEECIRAQGMARVTTKDIARHAGCSEGSIYNHFADKLDLLRAVITERLPDLDGLVGCLADRAGTGCVRDHLAEVLQVARAFFTQLVPLAGSVFADPELLARCRADMRRDGTGPHRILAATADYLRAEQALGRVDGAADPEVTAMVLVGAAYEYAYVELLTGEPPVAPGRLIAVLDVLGRALAPLEAADH